MFIPHANGLIAWQMAARETEYLISVVRQEITERQLYARLFVHILAVFFVGAGTCFVWGKAYSDIRPD